MIIRICLKQYRNSLKKTITKIDNNSLYLQNWQDLLLLWVMAQSISALHLYFLSFPVWVARRKKAWTQLKEMNINIDINIYKYIYTCKCMEIIPILQKAGGNIQSWDSVTILNIGYLSRISKKQIQVVCISKGYLK